MNENCYNLSNPGEIQLLFSKSGNFETFSKDGKIPNLKY